jgi:PTS system beta-glucosides-specific IIC component
MFRFLKRKKINICSPVSGENINIKEVNDLTFSEEMLGKGIAIIPADSKIYSPIKGEITMVFKTLHAIGIRGEHDEEILIHIGIDTVELDGQGFKCLVNVGERVKIGTLLLEVDIELIKNKGYDTIVTVIVTNSEEFEEFEELVSRFKKIKHGDKLLTFK